MNIADRICQEWTPERGVRFARAEATSFAAGWLREQGCKFASAAAAERAARGVVYVSWMVNTGRISEETER